MSDINVQELATKVVEELKKEPRKVKVFRCKQRSIKGYLRR